MNRLCDGCLIDKQRRIPFSIQTSYRIGETLELVHGDICRPIKPATPGGKTPFLLLVNDKSHFMLLILLQAKSEAAEAIKRIQVRAEIKCEKKMQMLHMDQGVEFSLVSFGKYCDKLGMQRQLTAPYSPQKNWVVER